MSTADPAPVPLETLVMRFIASARRDHDEGECQPDCPWCKFERQYPGRPYYQLFRGGKPPAPGTFTPWGEGGSP